MTQMTTKLAPGSFFLTVVALTVVSGLLAGLIASMTAGFQATLNLPFDGDLPTFRAAEAEVNSPAQWPLFAATLKSEQEKAEFLSFASQIVTGRSKVEHSFRLSRRDFLDLPESASKDMVERLINARGGRSNIKITARSHDPEIASRMARFGAEYMRYSLVAFRLKDQLRAWTKNLDGERAQMAADSLSRDSRFRSINRQLATMNELNTKIKDVGDLAQPLPTVDPNPVQVQVAGAKYLSPLRQIIGLQSALIDLNEERQIAIERLDYINALQAFATGKETTTLRDLMTAAENLQRATIEETPHGKLTAVAEINLRLWIVNALQTTPLEPTEPTIKRIGFGPFLSAGVGALAGLIAGFWLVYFRRQGNIWSKRAPSAQT